MKFAAKKTYISNTRANSYISNQVMQGRQLKFGAHVPQQMQQMAQMPQSELASQMPMAPQAAGQFNFDGGAHLIPPMPPQQMPPQPIISLEPKKLQAEDVFAISEKEEARPRLERKGSFESINDMELNRSLDSMSDEDEENESFGAPPQDDIFHAKKAEEEVKKKQEASAKKSGGLFGLFRKSKAKAPPPPPPAAMKAPKPKAFVTKSIFESKEKAAPPKKMKKKEREMARAHFVPVGEDAVERYEQEIDSNVMSINFNVLKELGNIASGDAVFCGKCQTAFNIHSVLLGREEIKKLRAKAKDLELIQEEEEEENKEELKEADVKQQILGAEDEWPDLMDDEQLWKCEFCGWKNIVQIEQEERPEADAINYVLESEVQAKEAAVGKSKHEDISIVFCIDISGSMCLTQSVKGKIKLKGGDNLSSLIKELSKFGDGSDQYLQGEARNTTYISRLQCLQAAIESQISQMAVGAPKRRVALVTFGSQVAIVGDGSQGVPRIIAGDRLNDADFVRAEALKCANGGYMSKPIGDTHEALVKEVMGLEEGGPTALGPALLAAITMAGAGKAGSKVVVCTDGMANVGLGSLEELKTDEDHAIADRFYGESCGDLAKSNGVEVSVITIKGENCRLEYLSKIAESSGGDVTIVDPSNLTQEFANILETPVIATHVQAKILLHSIMEFRNEKLIHLSSNRSTMVREIGNVTEQTEITFEYTLKKAEQIEEIEKQMGTGLLQLKVLPFQAQITYTTLDGKKCVRVISKKQEVGFEKEEIQKEANVNILATHAQQQSAALAKEGNYRRAQANMRLWKPTVAKACQNEEDLNDYKVWEKGAAQELYSNLQNVQMEEAADLGEKGEKRKLSLKSRKQNRHDSLANNIFQQQKYQNKSSLQKVKDFFSFKKS